MFGNSLQMIEIDWNVLEFLQIVCKKCYFNISELVGFIVWIVLAVDLYE